MENIETFERDDLAMVSMGAILHAGNAREAIFKAADKASQGEFVQADQMMQEANDELIAAHRAQTSTLQKEAEGIEIPYSSLFGHAQDHVMTVKTEHNLVKEIIKLYKRLEEKENG
ncbi:PTS lactose/cellobiose transporter subunit IIA [Lactococcus garvieae]|nr:PTS lactose/cellobiose transporter subunit IIA [Lactococcus garvieae]